WHQADDFAAAAHARPLGRAEEEELVTKDAPARGVAELVAREDAFGNAVGVVVEAIRSERRDAIELVERAVKRIRAGFRRDVDDAARSAPVFGGEVAGDDAELLHSVERYALADGGGEQVNVFAAVQQDVGRGRALTVDREACAAP